MPLHSPKFKTSLVKQSMTQWAQHGFHLLTAACPTQTSKQPPSHELNRRQRMSSHTKPREVQVLILKSSFFSLEFLLSTNSHSPQAAAQPYRAMKFCSVLLYHVKQSYLYLLSFTLHKDASCTSAPVCITNYSSLGTWAPMLSSPPYSQTHLKVLQLTLAAAQLLWWAFLHKGSHPACTSAAALSAWLSCWCSMHTNCPNTVWGSSVLMSGLSTRLLRTEEMMPCWE